MIRQLTMISLFLFGALLLSPGEASAEVSVGVSFDKDGLKSFHLAIGEHYNVPEQELVIIREKKIPDEDMPVIFFIADHAQVSHKKVIALRLKGLSWMDITLHFGLNAGIYYIPLKGKPGPPYGKAWGYFKKKKRKDWGSIRLVDIDIVNFVNLKFISERYGYAPEEVIKLRSKGDSFVNINGKVKKAKGMHKKQKVAQANKSGKGKKGKGKK